MASALVTEVRGETVGEAFVVGIDFSSLSGRAVVVRVSDGAELASAVHPYAHGVMDRELSAGDNRQLPPAWALQVPEDYREVLHVAVPEAVARAGVDPSDVVAIGTDFTACTMVPCLADRHTTERDPRSRERAACLRQALEAPCGSGTR